MFLALLSVFVLLGLATLLGVRTRTMSVEGGGYRLTLTYAQMTRPGLATPFRFVVERPGGLPDSIVVAVRSAYLEIFDENGLDPDPSKATSDKDWTYWHFDAPASGAVLSVDFDARLEPGVQWKRSGAVRIIDQGSVAAEALFTTWVAP